MTNVAAGALLAMGVITAVVAAPVAGAFLGASVLGGGLLGGALGFAAGVMALPVPLAALMTKDDPGNGKSRLRRIAGEVAGLYKDAFSIFTGIAKDLGGETFKAKPAPFVPRPDNDDPFRVGHLGGLFSGAAERLEPVPVEVPAVMKSRNVLGNNAP